MGILDFLFGKGKKEQERLRMEEEARQKKLKQEQLHKDKKTDGLATKNVAYLVVFSAPWCGPSKRFIKEIKEAGINNFAYINAEEEEDLAAKFSVRSVPITFLLDRNGMIIKKWIGYDDEDPGQSKFVRFIKDYPLPIVPYNKSVPGPFEKKKQNIEKTDRMTKERANNPSTNNLVEDNRTHFYELDDIKYRSMGSELMLAPYDFQFYIQAPDSKILPALANTKKIRRFLPNLGFTDEEATKKRLEGYLYKTEHQLGVTYVIRMNNFPIGMVFVNTPLYNKKTINKAIWTIDFFIAEHFEHKGIVYNAVLRVLNEMKNAMGAKVVYALVDQDNYDCIKLLGNGLFTKVDVEGFSNRDGGKPPFVYMIDIEHMNFIKR